MERPLIHFFGRRDPLSLLPSARESAASTYFPIVVGLNIGYLFLRIFLQWNSFTIYNGLATIVLIGLSCLSYKGILEDHANTIPGGGGGKSGSNSKALAGGASASGCFCIRLSETNGRARSTTPIRDTRTGALVRRLQFVTGVNEISNLKF